jgi:hypothetical protein
MDRVFRANPQKGGKVTSASNDRKSKTSRREFVEQTAGGAVLVSAAGALDTLNADSALTPQDGEQTKQYSKRIKPLSFRASPTHNGIGQEQIQQNPLLRLKTRVKSRSFMTAFWPNFYRLSAFDDCWSR